MNVIPTCTAIKCNGNKLNSIFPVVNVQVNKICGPIKTNAKTIEVTSHNQIQFPSNFEIYLVATAAMKAIHKSSENSMEFSQIDIEKVEFSGTLILAQWPCNQIHIDIKLISVPETHYRWWSDKIFASHGHIKYDLFNLRAGEKNSKNLWRHGTHYTSTVITCLQTPNHPNSAA